MSSSIRFGGRLIGRNSRFVTTYESVGDVGKSFSRIPSTCFSKNHLAIREHSCVSPDLSRSIHSDGSAVKGCASEPQVMGSILGGGIQMQQLKIHLTSSTQRRDRAGRILLLSLGFCDDSPLDVSPLSGCKKIY